MYGYPENVGLAISKPAISAAGENMIFTYMTNAVAYMTPGWSQIRIPSATLGSWQFPRKRGYGTAKIMSRDGCDPSRCVDQISEVAMSARGNYVAYATTRPEFCAPRRPRGYAGDRDCNQDDDIFMRFMGWSHEGYPLG